MTMALSPRDTWPDLRVTFHLLPWSWHVRPRLYHDDVEGWLGLSTFSWLFLHVEWYANRPMFKEPAGTQTLTEQPFGTTGHLAYTGGTNRDAPACGNTRGVDEALLGGPANV